MSERHVERVLSGRDTGDTELAGAVATLRRLAVEPDPAHARQAGASLAFVAAESAQPVAASSASTPMRWRVRAAVAGAVALVGAGLMGTAAAADEASPGDLLYDVDRALESFGIGDGGTEERIEEAQDLAEDGDGEGALELLADELDDEDGSEAALLAAAERIRDNGSEASAEVHERVAAMLEWMATTEATGRDFGQGVAARAKGLVVEEAEDPSEGTEATVEDTVSTAEAPGASGQAPGQLKKAEDAADDEENVEGAEEDAAPETPGRSGSAPGQAKTSDGAAPDAPGRSGSAPGQAGKGRP